MDTFVHKKATQNYVPQINTKSKHVLGNVQKSAPSNLLGDLEVWNPCDLDVQDVLWKRRIF